MGSRQEQGACGRVLCGGLLALLALTGAAVAFGAEAPVNRDPFVAVNRPIHDFNQVLDRHLVRPVAESYERVVPDPVERMVLNFFSNLIGPARITGAFLQADVDRTLIAGTRFAVNSTVGVAGLFDPATPMGLPDQQEDIGQALEVWGLENSPYIVLPFLGPATLVQIPDRALSIWLPQQLLGGYYTPAVGALDIVSFRASLLATSSIVDDSSLDTYTFTRDAFLQRRRFLRYNGELPAEDWSDFLDDF
ncbi:MAG TPA: VacJ family lipoprotein [Pseudomonadales bacterium]|nr:VacJ family lipoprotein [Pseudomonadales bacterium]